MTKVYLLWDRTDDGHIDLIGVYKNEYSASKALKEYIEQLPNYYRMELDEPSIASGFGRTVSFTEKEVIEVAS